MARKSAPAPAPVAPVPATKVTTTAGPTSNDAAAAEDAKRRQTTAIANETDKAGAASDYGNTVLGS